MITILILTSMCVLLIVTKVKSDKKEPVKRYYPDATQTEWLIYSTKLQQTCQETLSMQDEREEYFQFLADQSNGYYTKL